MAENVKKCPACGTLREAMSTQCSACDYEFRDNTTVVIVELNEKFDNLKNLSRKQYERKYIDVINNFPIPHVREELLDVLIYIQPKALDKESPIRNAWSLRQKEVIERAKLAFENKSKTLDLINKYERELVSYEKQFIKRGWQKMPKLLKALMIVLLLFILLLIAPAKDTSKEAYAIRFNKAIAKEQIDKAIKYLEKCPEMGTLISDDYLTLIDMLVEKHRLIEAESLFKDISEFTSSSIDKKHLKETTQRIIKYYVEKGDLGHAQQYAIDTESISYIIRLFLDDSDYESALSFYKKNTSKIVKYDAKLKQRVILTDDLVVVDFVKANTYGLE